MLKTRFSQDIDAITGYFVAIEMTINHSLNDKIYTRIKLFINEGDGITKLFATESRKEMNMFIEGFQKRRPDLEVPELNAVQEAMNLFLSSYLDAMSKVLVKE